MNIRTIVHAMGRLYCDCLDIVVSFVILEVLNRSRSKALSVGKVAQKKSQRRSRNSWLLPLVFGVVSGSLLSFQTPPIHNRAIVIDGHVDTPRLMISDKTLNIGQRNKRGHIDIPRMREGGLDAVFFSIWVSGSVTGSRAVKEAREQIDMMRSVIDAHPRELLLATSAADIQRAAAQGRIAALIGVEGGHMIGEDLAVLREFASRGVRYLTLTHSTNTRWADSSGDKRFHNGLTPFGRDVVRELNRLGVMVDVSHVSDKTFFDVLEVSKAPVIASHSSARAIFNHPRNMSDDMIRALARNRGVIMINYHAPFLGAPPVGWEKIVDHIDHAVKIAGLDHVGLGSDFDGGTMPAGMEDVSKIPRITEALLRRGYSEQNIAKILGGNLLRVMGEVEAARGR
jgi:membrane dipeptidase